MKRVYPIILLFALLLIIGVVVSKHRTGPAKKVTASANHAKAANSKSPAKPKTSAPDTPTVAVTQTPTDTITSTAVSSVAASIKPAAGHYASNIGSAQATSSRRISINVNTAATNNAQITDANVNTGTQNSSNGQPNTTAVQAGNNNSSTQGATSNPQNPNSNTNNTSTSSTPPAPVTTPVGNWYYVYFAQDPYNFVDQSPYVVNLDSIASVDPRTTIDYNSVNLCLNTPISYYCPNQHQQTVSNDVGTISYDPVTKNISLVLSQQFIDNYSQVPYGQFFYVYYQFQDMLGNYSNENWIGYEYNGPYFGN